LDKKKFYDAETFEERDEWIKVLTKVINAYYELRLFGIDLNEVAFRKYQMVEKIPKFLRIAIDYLSREEVIITEGIFRVSPFQSEVESYIQTIDGGNEVDFTNVNPHLVAALIKRYFRELPEPLIPFFAYEDISTAVENTNHIESIKQLKTIIAKFPNIHIDVLQELLKFLIKVSSFSEKKQNDTSKSINSCRTKHFQTKNSPNYFVSQLIV